MIEIHSTDFIRLLHKDQREKWGHAEEDIPAMFEHIYWKEGAIVAKTKEKTLTLRQFEKKYSDELIRLAQQGARPYTSFHLPQTGPRINGAE